MTLQDKGEHDDENVTLRSFLFSHIHRPHFKVCRLHISEVLFHEGKVFVTVMEGILIGDLPGYIALYDIAAVKERMLKRLIFSSMSLCAIAGSAFG